MASRSSWTASMAASRVKERCRLGTASMVMDTRAPQAWLPRGVFSVDRNQTQQVEIAQHFSGAQHHRGQRVVGDRDRQAGFFPDALVEIAQERAAAGEDDAAVADIGGKFRRSTFQRDT